MFPQRRLLSSALPGLRSVFGTTRSAVQTSAAHRQATSVFGSFFRALQRPQFRPFSLSTSTMAAEAESKTTSSLIGSEEHKITWKREDGSDVPGYVFGDASSKSAVVVIQEWWGVTEIVLQQAQKMSEKGFRVLVPDLYRGKLSLDAAEAHHLMDGLDWVGAVEDIRGAATYLKANGASKVGVTGFCMGGALTLAAGVRAEAVDAVAPFYGTPPDALADVSTIKVPVQGHFGKADTMEGFSDSKAVEALRAKLTTAGVDFEIFEYDGCDHGFMNCEYEDGAKLNTDLGRPVPPSEAVATAWTRLTDFFTARLA